MSHPMRSGFQGAIGSQEGQSTEGNTKGEAKGGGKGLKGTGSPGMSPTRMEAGNGAEVPLPASPPNSTGSQNGCQQQQTGPQQQQQAAFQTQQSFPQAPQMPCSGMSTGYVPMYDVRGLQGCVGSSVDPNTGNVPSQGGLFAGGMNPMLMQQQYGRVPPPPPQMSVQDVMQYASGMNQAQVVTLAQFFQEQLRHRSSGRGELFGQVATQVAAPFVAEFAAQGLPLPSAALQGSGGVATGNGQNGVRDPSFSSDPFSKSEKWLGSPPQPSFEKWKDCESEVLNWAQYIADLGAWASQASLEFGAEISQAAKWSTPISWSSMSLVMRSRSMRLLAILRSTFMQHPRSAMLIGAFMEGVNLQSLANGGASEVESANGYELLRQMTCEYSLRTRNEALVFRTSLAGRSFSLSPQETSPTSIVSDVVRKIDLEAARYKRLLSTLPSDVNSVGLELSEPDMLMILVRSLPEQARGYVLHHATGETYGAYRLAACRWEHQQRMVSELNLVQSNKKVNQVTGDSTGQGTEWFDMSSGENWSGDWNNGDWNVDSMNGSKCSRCGSKKHSTNDCTTDLSKTKCFRCNNTGHVSQNCPDRNNKGSGKGQKGKGVIKGNWNKGKGKDGGKSKGKGKFKGGQKGKMNEVQEQDWSEWSAADWWWHDDSDSYWWYQNEVSQGNWEWPSSSQAWDHQKWDQNAQGEGQGTQEANSKGEHIGSLVLSPVLQTDGFEFCREIGHLILEEAEVFPEPIEVETDVFVETTNLPSFSNSCGLVMSELEQETDSADLLSDVCGRVLLVRGNPNLFDNQSECAVATQLERNLPVLQPLLSQMAEQTDASWWLLDSGASMTVLSETCLHAFGVQVETNNTLGNFRAANGSDVSMLGSAKVGVHMYMSDSTGSSKSWKKARLNVLVGKIQHNILSVTALADSGWRFTQGPNGFDLVHTADGLHCLEVDYYANCPWVRLHPDLSVQVVSGNGINAVSATSATPSGSLCPLSTGVDHELELHRRQGHIPFHPRCLECARGRSVFQHRRKTGDKREAEIQADFAFLSQSGEISFEESERAVKILVMSEMLSGCLGAVVVGDVEQTRREIKTWLDHFGLMSKSTSVVVHTDAELGVGELIGHATGDYTFQIRRASPQQHRSIGGAERGVREIKEALSVLRADMNHQRLDVHFSGAGLTDCLTYLCLCHNHFAKAKGTDASPLELSSGRKLSRPVVSLFGSTVLAELPDSVRSVCPNETRNVEASFVHCGLQRGAVVQAKVRTEGSHELLRFTARNVRPISPLSWRMDLCQELVTELEGGDDDMRVIQDRTGVEAPAEALEERSEPPPVQHAVDDVDVSELNPEERRKLKSQSMSHEEVVRLRPQSSDVGQVGQPSGSVSVPPRHLEVPGKPVSRTRKGPGVFMRREATPVVRTQMDGECNADLPGSEQRVERGPSLQGGGDSQDVGVEVPEAFVEEKFTPTRRCPACESGFDAPGTRHNAACKKRFAEFQGRLKDSRSNKERKVEFSVPVEQPVENPNETSVSGQQENSPTPEDVQVSASPGEAGQVDERMLEYHERFKSKRSAEVPVEELEREMQESAVVCVEESLDFDFFWSDTGLPVLLNELHWIEGGPSFVPATGPDMFSGSLESVKFSGGEGHVAETMTLGGAQVKVWKPTAMVDDQTLQELNVELGYEGMKEEIRNMEKCQTGRIIGEEEFQQLKRKNPGLRLIASRWVCAYKSEVRTRARIVAKDYNRGATARSLGFSSPTPSIESVHLGLAIASSRGYRLRALDISHAFMHSPIQSGMVIVLRMPMSVSTAEGGTSYMVLSKALNGLRDASLCWLELLASTVRKVGLWSDEVEPCVYSGEVYSDAEEFLGHSAIVYVDDILLMSSSQEAEEQVVSVISKIVPTKTTGSVDDAGGSLSFIGRKISKVANSNELFLSVDPSYLDSTFQDYGIVRGSDFVPDVASHLEKAHNDKSLQKPLSDEAYGKFRRGLGRLLWLAQVRHDLKAWLSIIGTQQSKPTQSTEQALRAVLRFMFNDRHTGLCFPSRCESLVEGLEENQLKTIHLHSFADASFAPYRFNNRRGLSGGAVYFERSLVRTTSKQQQALALSSCEAELYALQAICQESIAFSKLTHRLMFSLGEMEERQAVHVYMESDSSSAIQLLRAIDIPKKSRHVEIRLLWLREQLGSGHLFLKHRAGTSNPSDLFTKCLSSKDFFKHRYTLGLVSMDGLVFQLMSENQLFVASVGMRKLAFVELCCSDFSSLRAACQFSKIPYVGVAANMQTKGVFSKVQQMMGEWQRTGFHVHLHASTPCSSGSPLKRFSGSVTEADLEWGDIISAVHLYMKKADSSSFELPAKNDIWSREETHTLLAQCCLDFESLIKLCRFGVKTSGGLPIGKTLKFVATHVEFTECLSRKGSGCSCEMHANLNETDFTSTGFYNRKLARAILDAAKACVRSENKRRRAT